MPLVLRDYQEEAVNRTLNWLTVKDINPMIVVPTGGGKSLIIAEVIRRAKLAQPGLRVLLATHVRELVEQNYAEMKSWWPEAPIGICSAGMGEENYREEITIGTVQTLVNRAWALARIGLIIVDEAHMIGRRDGSRYQRMFRAMFGRAERRIPIVGATATPYRLDSGFLHRGDGAMFDVIASNASAARLVTAGYLAPLTNVIGDTQIDTSQMRRRGGEDFTVASMQAEVLRQGMTGPALDEVMRHGRDRRSWLIFAVSIRHAEVITAYLNAQGVSARTLSHELKKNERDQVIEEFRAGLFRALVSVNIVAVGFNVPRIDLVAMIRPTVSTGFYVQMLGRGMRPFPGKTDCIALDFGGNIVRHGPINDPKVERGTRNMPSRLWKRTKICSDCGAEIGVFFRTCPGCGHLFSAVRGEADLDHPVLDMSRAGIKQDKTPREIRRSIGPRFQRIEGDPFLEYLAELRDR